MKLIIFFFGGRGGGHKKLIYFWTSFLCILRYFLNVKIQNGNSLFLGGSLCLIFLIFFGGKQKIMGPTYVTRNIESIHPTPWIFFSLI